MNKIKYIATTLVFCLIVGGFCGWLLIKSPDKISDWERRPLAQFPEVSYENLMEGRFMRDFESYANEQFPLRNTFRRIKAMVLFNLYQQKDNNGVYFAEGHVSKYDSVITRQQLDDFNKAINSIYEDNIKGSDCKVYYSIIPDKNYFLAEKNGYPGFDYDYLYSEVNKGLGKNMQEIVIKDKLMADNFYKTDTHWRQESIVDVANHIRKEMGMKPVDDYTQHSAGDFYGVYYGQSALDLEPDEIIYLENEQIMAATVFDVEKNKNVPVYDLDKLSELDHYDLFLSGARRPFMKITNPMGEEDKRLIVFRDSFGSSLVPLLISDYSEIVVIDIRDLHPNMIPQLVEFTVQDVLFIYSTMVVNSKEILR